MEKEFNEKRDQYLTYTDILAIFKLGSDIQWKEIRQNSLYRILYLSSVLYSFRYPEKENPFNLYKFSVDPTGPYDSNISRAIDFLIKDEYLVRTSGEDIFKLAKFSGEDVLKIDIGQERIEWLKQVMYILGIYGENKIYDFIFRDPQYQTTIKSNTLQSLNTDINNETIKTLKSFQKAFEETLTEKKEKLSSQTYLELYFEYVFSRILKKRRLNMVDFNDLKKYIRDNYEEVSMILESQRLTILNAPEIKFLHGKFLIDFWKERPNRNLAFVIFFKEAIIGELDFNNILKNLNNTINETLKTHKIIEVDKDFNVIDKRAEQTSKELLITLSESKNVVFFFGEEGIEVAIRGKLIDNINFFYNESDRLKFLKKHHISNLQACLKDYEVYIKEPGVNEAFFASKILIAKIQPTNPPNNTLQNKPENILRNNLLTYLNRNTQHSFSKENELNNRRELDLYTEVEGKKYLIEVKWLGQAVNEDESDFTKKVTDFSARDGVIQTLEYIKHLIEEMSFNLHCGYLCVFDAREIKTPVNYKNFNFITQELKPYYQNHFIKLEEIPLNRNH